MIKTIHEPYKTLELQVEALKDGTNPIVFFPIGTPAIPKLPYGAKRAMKDSGIFYYNSSLISEDMIDQAIRKNLVYLLLGFVQDKKEAIKGGCPIAVVARDLDGNEIKTAVVDSYNPRLVSFQEYIFYQFFPKSIVRADTVFNVIAERLCKNGELDG